MNSTAAVEPAVRSWSLKVLAELAAWRGDLDTASRHLREALKHAPEDRQLLVAYADILLDADQPAAVTRLLQGLQVHDGLLLRRALAAAAVGSPDAQSHAENLGRRFALAQRRGDELHLREQARAAISLFDVPATAALELALENWALQREPADARLVLEAALGAARPEAARGAIDWLEQTGFDDPRLACLVARLRGMAE